VAVFFFFFFFFLVSFSDESIAVSFSLRAASVCLSSCACACVCVCVWPTGLVVSPALVDPFSLFLSSPLLPSLSHLPLATHLLVFLAFSSSPTALRRQLLAGQSGCCIAVCTFERNTFLLSSIFISSSSSSCYHLRERGGLLLLPSPLLGSPRSRKGPREM